jgi:hypothetical protein
LIDQIKIVQLIILLSVSRINKLPERDYMGDMILSMTKLQAPSIMMVTVLQSKLKARSAEAQARRRVRRASATPTVPRETRKKDDAMVLVMIDSAANGMLVMQNKIALFISRYTYFQEQKCLCVPVLY